MDKQDKEKKIGLTIAELSKATNISRYTLKYWSNIGLLPYIKNNENNYRYYDISSIEVLTTLIFFRKLGVPIKEIKKLDILDRNGFRDYYQKKINDIDKQIEVLTNNKSVLFERLNILDNLSELEDTKYFEQEPIFNYLYELDLFNTKMVNAYAHLKLRSIALRYYNENNTIIQINAVDSKKKIKDWKLIWEKTKSDKFLMCVIKLKDNTIDKEKENKVIDDIKNMGHTPKMLLYQFHMQYLEKDYAVTAYKLYVQM